jgi:hypothetical protein
MVSLIPDFRYENRLNAHINKSIIDFKPQNVATNYILLKNVINLDNKNIVSIFVAFLKIKSYVHTKKQSKIGKRQRISVGDAL